MMSLQSTKSNHGSGSSFGVWIVGLTSCFADTGIARRTNISTGVY